MNGPAEIWQMATGSFDATLAQVGDDQWDAATGCGDWTVRELVDHTLFWQCNLAATVGAEAAPEDGWDNIRAAIGSALEDPAALEGTLESGPMTGMPKHQAMGFATADVLLHGWDLARAIGADDTLPEPAVQAVHMGMSQAPEEMIRNPQVFGPAVEVPADASPQDKLLGFSGRQP
ncbi:MAG: TIGR03086 family metal-binding protein [Acidimicrobiia bacterium]